MYVCRRQLTLMPPSPVPGVDTFHLDEDDYEAGEQDERRHPDEEHTHHQPVVAHSVDVRLLTHFVQKVRVLTLLWNG